MKYIIALLVLLTLGVTANRAYAYCSVDEINAVICFDGSEFDSRGPWFDCITLTDGTQVCDAFHGYGSQVAYNAAQEIVAARPIPTFPKALPRSDIQTTYPDPGSLIGRCWRTNASGSMASTDENEGDRWRCFRIVQLVLGCYLEIGCDWYDRGGSSCEYSLRCPG